MRKWPKTEEIADNWRGLPNLETIAQHLRIVILGLNEIVAMKKGQARPI
jgi:hypothetical protein